MSVNVGEYIMSWCCLLYQSLGSNSSAGTGSVAAQSSQLRRSDGLRFLPQSASVSRVTNDDWRRSDAGNAAGLYLLCSVFCSSPHCSALSSSPLWSTLPFLALCWPALPSSIPACHPAAVPLTWPLAGRPVVCNHV